MMHRSAVLSRQERRPRRQGSRSQTNLGSDFVRVEQPFVGYIVLTRRLPSRSNGSGQWNTSKSRGRSGEACDYDPPSDTGDRLATDLGSVKKARTLTEKVFKLETETLCRCGCMLGGIKQAVEPEVLSGRLSALRTLEPVL